MDKQQNKTCVERSRNIPLVRFPEFKEEWELIHGNELFERISNKNHNSDLPILAISQEFGAIPRELINYKISVTEKSVSSYKVVEKGDFIISLRSFQGGIEYSNYKGICSPAYIILRPSVKLDDYFFKVHFKSYRYIQQLKSKLEGIRDGKMISYKYFSEIKLPFPTLPEQQKIAHFFTTIDKKLKQLQEKKSHLEQYKKGIMQQIFSQKIRFKDDNGQDFPEWEVKKLGEVTNYTKGFAFKSTNYTNNGVRIIRVSDLGARKIKDKGNKIFIDELRTKDFINYKLNKGDIIITTVGSNPELRNSSVGRGIFVTKNNMGFLNQNLLKFNVNSKYNNKFIYGFINTNKYFHYIKSIKRGNANQANITVVDLLDYKISLPILKEQTKIANFLSKIDEKINNVNEQIEQTKLWKKGLLQKMFVN